MWIDMLHNGQCFCIRRRIFGNKGLRRAPYVASFRQVVFVYGLVVVRECICRTLRTEFERPLLRRAVLRPRTYYSRVQHAASSEGLEVCACFRL